MRFWGIYYLLPSDNRDVAGWCVKQGHYSPAKCLEAGKKYLALTGRTAVNDSPVLAIEDVYLFALRHRAQARRPPFRKSVGTDRGGSMTTTTMSPLKAGQSHVFKNWTLQRVSGRPFGQCTVEMSPRAAVILADRCKMRRVRSRIQLAVACVRKRMN